MKALFVDENAQQIYGAKKTLERDGWECVQCSFSEALVTFRRHVPDLLVLDLMNGGTSDDSEGSAGNGVFVSLLSEVFCPIIVYSANPALLRDCRAPSPLMESVKKGRGASTRVKEAAARLIPAVTAVKTVRDSVNQALDCSLRQFLPQYFTKGAPIKVHGDAKTYVYLARRRVAAMLDEMAADGEKLQVWEQYLYPALGDYPLLGDLLLSTKSDVNDPGSYRLVLTPSCDLDASSRRKPKVDNILVAKCEPVTGVVAEGLRNPISKKVADKAEQGFKGALTEGLGGSAIPLPGIPGVFPDMCANLKTLELLEYSTDGTSISGKCGGRAVTFRRIASVDSPFREQVAWNYQRIACRPGMPDRDIGKWAETVTKQLQAKSGQAET